MVATKCATTRVSVIDKVFLNNYNKHLSVSKSATHDTIVVPHEGATREERMMGTTVAPATQQEALVEMVDSVEEMAVAYHEGRGAFGDMELYTIVIGRHSRQFGMTWGDLRDELRDVVKKVVNERGPTTNNVAVLLMSGV